MAKSNGELREAIGRRLRRWREERGGEQKKTFWPQCGLNPLKMGRYENGRETPSPERIVEICWKTGMSADYLLLGKRAKEKKPEVKPRVMDRRRT